MLLLLPECVSLFFFILSLYLCHPHFPSLHVCVCLNVFISFVYMLFSFSHLNSHRLPLPPCAFQERCNFFLIILMHPVLPPVFFCLCSPVFIFSFSFKTCSCVHTKYVLVSPCRGWVFLFFVNFRCLFPLSLSNRWWWWPSRAVLGAFLALQ